MTMPRCSRIDWVPVLTSEEIEFLDKVKTTQRQAAQILRRNTALLRLLDFGTSGTVYIGCPHCASSRYVAVRKGCACCSVCPWTMAGGLEFGSLSGGCCCLFVPFGGVCAGYQNGVAYRVDDARIYSNAGEEALTLVRGHIEWAERVLGIEPGAKTTELRLSRFGRVAAAPVLIYETGR